MGEIDPFGYLGHPAHLVQGVRVEEGRDAATLEPGVIVTVTFAKFGVMPVTLALTPDMADELAGQLTEWAARARAKHWE